MVGKAARLWKDEQGIQHAEEALLLGLLATAMTGAVNGLRVQIGALLATATGAFP